MTNFKNITNMNSRQETFEQWSKEPRNKEFLDHYNVDLFAARRIWDAANIEAMHAIMNMVLDGTLILNQDKSQPK